MKNCDMIVNLSSLSVPVPEIPGVKLKRAFPGDISKILGFVRENFNEGWVGEAQKAILSTPPSCFIAVRDKKVIGFACYDSSARGFFGPIGVSEDERGKNVGTALLVRTLKAMEEYGYGYAVIGWVSDARSFYQKTVGASDIPGGEPENSVYRNMINI